MPIDPVCGMEVDEKSAKDRATFEGQPFFFCSRDCKEEFDEAPEDYVGDENFGDEGLERTGT
jgi:P-type Cu+ transporter